MRGLVHEMGIPQMHPTPIFTDIGYLRHRPYSTVARPSGSHPPPPQSLRRPTNSLHAGAELKAEKRVSKEGLQADSEEHL